MEREASEKRRDLFRGRSRAWDSQDRMDLPDLISGQFERSRKKQIAGEASAEHGHTARAV